MWFSAQASLNDIRAKLSAKALALRSCNSPCNLVQCNLNDLTKDVSSKFKSFRGWISNRISFSGMRGIWNLVIIILLRTFPLRKYLNIVAYLCISVQFHLQVYAADLITIKFIWVCNRKSMCCPAPLQLEVASSTCNSSTVLVSYDCLWLKFTQSTHNLS